MPEPTARIDNSILHDVKQMVGQEWDDTTYDLDIMTHINSVFLDLHQIVVGLPDDFSIMDASTLWDAYLGDIKNLSAIKSYIFIRVRLLFDPPTNGFLVTSLEKQADRMEWRLMVETDPPLSTVQGVVNE